MEDQERGGGLRALDGKESGRNAACKKTPAGSGEITYKKEKGPKYTVLPDF